MAAPPQPAFFRRWTIPVLIAANAIAVLCFRHVVSLDGPMHLLHAALMKDAWTGQVPNAQGIRATTSAWGLSSSDLLLLPLSGIAPVFLLHQLIMSFAVLVLSLGTWMMGRAYGRSLNAEWLLILPCTFSFLLLLGLFSFLIAMGTALACAAWWTRREHVRASTLGWLAAAFILCTFAHKSGGCVLLLLVGAHELFLFGSNRPVWNERWKAIPKKFMGAAIVAIIVATSIVLYRLLVQAAWCPEEHRPLRELFTLRALLLVDSRAELPLRAGIGILFAVLFSLAFRERWKKDQREHASDALLLSAGLLVLASLIARTPEAEALYIPDRAQLLALLLVACWTAVQSLPRKAMALSAAAILLLHSARMVYIERRMHGMEERDRLTLDAAAHLDPHAFTVPAVLDKDWVAQHNTAYVASAMNGIVFTGRDHVRFQWKKEPTMRVYSYIFSFENNWTWIAPHCATGTSPELHHVLVLGHGSIPPDAAEDSLRVGLKKYYTSTYHNVYAEVWTLK